MFAGAEQNRQLRAQDSSHLRGLLWIVETGLGGEALCRKVSSHYSSGRDLPIIGGTLPQGRSKVTVTHLGNNGISHICAVSLEQPLYPNLLYPIARLFGDHSPSSHGAGRELALPNFEARYHENTPISRFSMQGDYFTLACALRYLHLVSQLDGEAVQDACLRKTRHGAVSAIHGNHIEKRDLLAALKLTETSSHPYEFRPTTTVGGILSTCLVKRFGHGTCEGQSVVEIVLQEGTLLPELPVRSPVFVRLADTALAGKVTTQESLRTVFIGEDINSQALNLIPAAILGRSSWNDAPGGPFRIGASDPYPVHPAITAVRPGARHFAFEVPNELDGLLVAMLLDQAVSPIVTSLMPRANPIAGASFGARATQ